jgi:medium-chain acyl-[acyl-carrier-protein] hydrolase
VLLLAAAVVDELGRFLKPPFALFGHSMGALLAFEVARHLRRRGKSAPVCLVVSAHRAPHIPDEQDKIHDKPTSDFLEELRRLNGTPAEVLRNDELVELISRRSNPIAMSTSRRWGVRSSPMAELKTT